jgi:hypothetical protein
MNRSNGHDWGGLVEDTRLTAGTAGGASAEMLSISSSGGTVRRLQMWTGSKDMFIGTAVLMQDSYFDLINNQFESPSSHSDGVQVSGGCGPHWYVHNTMLTDPVKEGSGPGQVASNASIFLKGRWSNTVCPSIYSAVVQNNYLAGGIITARMHSDSAGRIINSRWVDNVWDDDNHTPKGSSCRQNIANYSVVQRPDPNPSGNQLCFEYDNNTNEAGTPMESIESDCKSGNMLGRDQCLDIEPIPTTTISNFTVGTTSCTQGQAACNNITLSANVSTTEGPRARGTTNGDLYDGPSPGGSFRWRYSCGGSPGNTAAQPCAEGHCSGYEDNGADLWYHYPDCNGQSSCTMTGVCDYQAEGQGTYTAKIYAEAGPGAAFRPSDHDEATFTVR